MGLSEILRKNSGVVTGEDILKIFRYATEHQFAIPAVNACTSAVIGAALQAARGKNAPLIIETSQTDSLFFAGKQIDNTNEAASFAGSLGAAHFVRAVAPLYGVPVIMHTDHCKRPMLSWLDAMLDADEEYFERNGEPLWSSHMVDFSAEDKEWNITACQHYFKRMAKMNQWLEMEIGMVGEAHHAISETSLLPESAFTKSEDVWDVYRALQPISPHWSIALAFGNVHGIYREGNVKLRPNLLSQHQHYVVKKLQEADLGTVIPRNPVFLVMHGGSGSDEQAFRDAIAHGVVKVNINAATQFTYCAGIREYMLDRKEYLDKPVGNPDDPVAPNKQFYDTRQWIQQGQWRMMECLEQILDSMNTSHQL